QTGVAAGTIQPRQAAVLRGQVLDRSNAPLVGVTIAVLNYAEYGTTQSRADGGFDLAVNGGGPLVVTYTKAGYLPVHRLASVPWQDYVWLPNVVLIPVDSAATAVNLATSTTMQVARGNPASDGNGSRQAT